MKLQAVITTDKWMIPICMIEAVQEQTSGEDATIDALKGSLTISIITKSGKQYSVCMEELAEHISEADGSDTNSVYTAGQAYYMFNRDWLGTFDA